MLLKFLGRALPVSGLALILVTGCSSIRFNQSDATLNGNWSFTAQPLNASSSPLVLNAGITEEANGSVNAVAHLSGASCVGAATGIRLAGSVSLFNSVILTSQPFDGTTLSLKGQLINGGKAISNASWTFSGGNCAALGAAAIEATGYSEISGTYTGTFVDVDNNQLAITATLTQTSEPDQSGQFHLTGSATFPDNPCFTQPIVTDSLVTGDNLSTTYTEGSASITAVGTFNSDATQLTVTNWQVSGGLCDGDSGTGTLSEE
jgi:hypothetical protein